MPRLKNINLSLTHSLSMSVNSTRLLPYLCIGGIESVNSMDTIELLSLTSIVNVSNDCVNWFEGKSDVRYMRVPIDDEVTADASRFFAATHAFIEQVHRQHTAGHKACVMVHCKTGMSRSTTIVLSHMLQAPGMLRYIAEFTDRQGLLLAADAAGGGLADGHGDDDDDDCDAAGARDAGHATLADPTAATASVSATVPVAVAVRPSSSGGRFAHRSSPFMTLRDALAYVRERRPRASPNAGFMQQLLELEARLHGGAVTIDLDRYKVDRFGDVRSFCIGEVDPVCGYTGSAAAAAAAVAMDDEFLVTGGVAGRMAAGAGGGGGWPPVPHQRPLARPLECPPTVAAGGDPAAAAAGTMVVASASDVPTFDRGSLRAPASVTVTDIVRPPPPVPSLPAPVLEAPIEEGGSMRALSIDDNATGPGFQVTTVAAPAPQAPPAPAASALGSSGPAARVRLQAPQWTFDSSAGSASVVPAVSTGSTGGGSRGVVGSAGGAGAHRPLRKRKTKYTFGEDTSDDEDTTPRPSAVRGSAAVGSHTPTLPAAATQSPRAPPAQAQQVAAITTARPTAGTMGACSSTPGIAAATTSPGVPVMQLPTYDAAIGSLAAAPAHHGHHRPQMSGLSMVTVSTGISTGGSGGHASVDSGDLPMVGAFGHGGGSGGRKGTMRGWHHGRHDLAGLVASVVAASPPLAGTSMAVIRGGLSPPTHPSAGRPRRGSTGGMVIERFATAGSSTGVGSARVSGAGLGSGETHYSPLATSPTATHTVTSFASLTASGSGGGGSNWSLLTGATGGDTVSLHAASAAGGGGGGGGGGTAAAPSTGTATASACCVSRVLSPPPAPPVALAGMQGHERGGAAWGLGCVTGGDGAAIAAVHDRTLAHDALGRFMAGAAMPSPPLSTGRSDAVHTHRASGGIASPPPLGGSPFRSFGTDGAPQHRHALQLPMPVPVSSASSRLAAGPPASARAAFGSGSSTGRSAGSPGGFAGSAAGIGRPRRASTASISGVAPEALAAPHHHAAYR